MYGNYALKIENWHSDKPDIRNNPKMIAILSQNDLLHAGLAITTSSVEIIGIQLTFKFTITNNDQSDLMIIDLDNFIGTNNTPPSTSISIMKFLVTP